MFEKIYNDAKKSAKLNMEKQEEEIKEKEKIELTLSEEERIRDTDSEKAKWEVKYEYPQESEVFSKELLNIVKNNKFNVTEYGKRVDEIDFYSEYCPVTEYYSVTYNHYKFIIKNLSDVDITDGIFAVYKVINTLTNEKISYYLDLGCRNTSKEKYDTFLLLINSKDLNEFINKKYSYIKEISELLKKYNYEIEDNINYAPDKLSGYMSIKDIPNIYIVPYSAWMDEIRIVVTNNKAWNSNTYNGRRTIGYYIDYQSEKDIEKIATNIAALQKHLSNEYGYYENGTYYQNEDIENLLEQVRKTNKDGLLNELVNHYHIQIKQVRPWDGRGYGNPYINVAEGLEMAVHFEFLINDAAQWSIGDIINNSDIVIKYDKRIDPENCILMIKNYQYTAKDDYTIYADEEDGFLEKIDTLHENINQEFLVDEIMFKGTFTQVYDTLKTYMNDLCKIYNLDFEFE